MAPLVCNSLFQRQVLLAPILVKVWKKQINCHGRKAPQNNFLRVTKLLAGKTRQPSESAQLSGT